MGKVRNFLFIMCDQLRADYLSCYGHPAIETPNIDHIAKRGVLFDRAYCQSPICGPSRASFYTGRYMSNHGVTWNNVPLPIGETTLGDYMRPLSLRTAVIGKTHISPDLEGLKRINIKPESTEGIFLSQGGFEPYERDDGLHPDISVNSNLAYNNYLRGKGYESSNPWHDFANSAEDKNGAILSGWYMRNSNRPARIRPEDSETSYMTDRAIDFLYKVGGAPWCLHLSYIKPHWPYMAPAPYHTLYSANQIKPPNRGADELNNPHPVVSAFMQHEDSKNFQSEEVRRRVIPTYMGLIKQIDDNIGRLMKHLSDLGRNEDTMIVFTSDHGDYLGDHWLGEKELFHEESARIPFILFDPSASANATRGTKNSNLVESVDVIPTFLDALKANIPYNKLEGRSLLPLIRQFTETKAWRDTAFSEAEYAVRKARIRLKLQPIDCRAFMAVTASWKYIFYEHHRPQLFNLEDDPNEQFDLGEDPKHQTIRDDFKEKLFTWMRTRPIRRTRTESEIASLTGRAKERGYFIGVW